MIQLHPDHRCYYGDIANYGMSGHHSYTHMAHVMHATHTLLAPPHGVYVRIGEFTEVMFF